MPKTKNPITAKRARFIEEYVVDCDATHAAIRAGFSDRTAYSIGHQLLAKPLIADAIAAARAKMAKKAEASAERVIAEYCALGFLDPRDFYDGDGNLLPIQQMPERARRALTGMDVEEIFEGKGEERRAIGRLRKIRFAQKQSALDSLAKHLGLFQGGEGPGVNVDNINVLVSDQDAARLFQHLNERFGHLFDDTTGKRQAELTLSRAVGRVVTLEQAVEALRAKRSPAAAQSAIETSAAPVPQDEPPPPVASTAPPAPAPVTDIRQHQSRLLARLDDHRHRW